MSTALATCNNIICLNFCAVPSKKQHLPEQNIIDLTMDAEDSDDSNEGMDDAISEWLSEKIKTEPSTPERKLVNLQKFCYLFIQSSPGNCHLNLHLP